MSQLGIKLEPFEQLVNSYSGAESSTYERDQWRMLTTWLPQVHVLHEHT
jgi:hypothetical protein